MDANWSKIDYAVILLCSSWLMIGWQIELYQTKCICEFADRTFLFVCLKKESILC